MDDELEVIPDEEGEAPELQGKIKKLKADVKKCEIEKREYLDGWQRAKADFINFRNEEGKRMEDMARFITAGFVQDVLPVLDSFELALSASRRNELPAEVERGVLLIRSQFTDILKKRGLEEISAEKGTVFNPEKHEAVGEVESDAPEGTVAEVVQKGYMLRGRVLRPARVRLSVGK